MPNSPAKAGARWARMVNQVAVDTRWGVRRFELFHGDLTQLPLTERVDVLTLSVFPGVYDPRPGSMIGSLYESFGLRLEPLRAASAIDATAAFGCWLSEELPANLPFRRLLVDETLGTDGRNVGDVLVNIFAFGTALEAKGIPLRSIAMPLMGAGVQKLDARSIVEPLLTHSLAFLERARTVERVRFVERDQERVTYLSEAMNTHLGRVAVGLGTSSLAAALCKDLSVFAEAHAVGDAPHVEVLHELAGILRSPDDVSIQLFAAARRVAEAVVADLHAPRKPADVLWKATDALTGLGYAPWLPSYLHVLRVFGNETVHYHTKEHDRRPGHLLHADLEVCLVLLDRVLRMWLVEMQPAVE